ncbi:hypothetical protein KM043_011381 [Ampulex compressa]|nr:hypothetical protein KM043_011381 [Ampulex compressa]
MEKGGKEDPEKRGDPQEKGFEGIEAQRPEIFPHQKQRAPTFLPEENGSSFPYGRISASESAGPFRHGRNREADVIDSLSSAVSRYNPYQPDAESETRSALTRA